MKQKTILCYGDSNTWGYPPDGSARYCRDVRWTGVLQNELGAGYDVIEEGHCGRTTVWDDPIEGHKNGYEQLTPILQSHCPLELVVIMLGTNDLKNRFNVSALDIAWSIGRLVEAVKSSQTPYTGNVPQVLVICPPPLADMSKSPFRDILIGGEEKSKQLAAEFKAYCEQNKIEWLNAGDVIKSSPVDGVHFEPSEHKKLGKAVAEKVIKMLG